MVAQDAYNSYKQNSILTARPEELTLMLYNGLVKYIMLARKAIEEKDIQKAHDSIIRAEDIIAEFMASLDMKYEISHNLALLYDYMYDRLITANIKKDISILDEVLHFAKDLRDTWAKAMKLASQDKKTAEAAK
ncbi:MAG: flagellar export chaperone FliS [Acetivibrionales bacterium]